MELLRVLDLRGVAQLRELHQRTVRESQETDIRNQTDFSMMKSSITYPPPMSVFSSRRTV